MKYFQKMPRIHDYSWIKIKRIFPAYVQHSGAILLIFTIRNKGIFNQHTLSIVKERRNMTKNRNCRNLLFECIDCHYHPNILLIFET